MVTRQILNCLKTKTKRRPVCYYNVTHWRIQAGGVCPPPSLLLLVLFFFRSNYMKQGEKRENTKLLYKRGFYCVYMHGDGMN